MPLVCGVRFRGTNKIYYFSPGGIKNLQVKDQVVVETSRGTELAQVVTPVQEVDESEIVGELKPILRRATTIDLLEAERYRQKEADAVRKCKEQVAKSKLPMKIVGAEYNYDGSRLTFFFTAEQRVDFRALVRELARIFKTRIELRQIGVRDEAKLLGGIGICGRPLCCATWLCEFSPVSIRMAKQQNLPLNPMEISGLCGRLRCCLTYENDFYKQAAKKFPKVGKRIDTPLGPAKVIKVSVLKEKATLLFEDGTTLELTAEQLAGEEPIQPTKAFCPKRLEALTSESLDNADQRRSRTGPEIENAPGKRSNQRGDSAASSGANRRRPSKKNSRGKHRRRNSKKKAPNERGAHNNATGREKQKPRTSNRENPSRKRPSNRKRSRRPNTSKGT